VPALNAYAARCQAVLQSGKPDNDILLYWPIFDRWSSPTGSVQPFTVHARDWLEQQPVGKAAETLWNLGYQFDYVSDHQLASAKVKDRKIETPGGLYRAVVVPKCEYMPLETLKKLDGFRQAGVIVIYQDQLPKDVPGLGRLDGRRSEFKKLTGWMEANSIRVLVGDLNTELAGASVSRETLFDQPGLMCVRRQIDDGRFYFIANRGEKAIDGWVPLATEAKSVVILDPLTGRSGVAASRAATNQTTEVYLQLPPGGSIVLHTLTDRKVRGVSWNYWNSDGAAATLQGRWQVKFVQGGPELPASFAAEQLGSWTASGDTNAQRFAGSALYSLTFDAPAGSAKEWQLDLGKVCQSARVRLNGRELGTLITPPFRVAVDKLKRKGNVLEVEVTNVSANRIRDLDRRGVKWKTFNDINFVNLAYQPFNAANWPLTDSGLLGPVTLTPLKVAAMKQGGQ
jgi:hypothetical protein